jgi:hypothetical protein
MVLQQERLLPLQRPLSEPRVQSHDAAGMHGQELGRRVQQVVPGHEQYIPLPTKPPPQPS